MKKRTQKARIATYTHYPDHDGADHEQDHVDKEEKPNVSPNILFLLTLIPWIFRQAKIR